MTTKQEMIAIVKAQFNELITDLLEEGCTQFLQEKNSMAWECAFRLVLVEFEETRIKNESTSSSKKNNGK
jgi:6,7-dimethyl-8-ribityllumazine synthase